MTGIAYMLPINTRKKMFYQIHFFHFFHYIVIFKNEKSEKGEVRKNIFFYQNLTTIFKKYHDSKRENIS